MLIGLVGWNFFRQTTFPQPDFRSERPVAVMTALGRINLPCYPEPEMRAHRMEAIAVTQRLGRRLPVLCKDEGVPNWAGHVWREALRTSKICLSPCGYDPTCFRDYEAALHGCVVFKPDTSFCVTWPQAPYVSIRPDYADFEERVAEVLLHWIRYEESR